MCGIIGIASNKPVSINIINSLKKLEYRGYDSAGLATLSDNLIDEKKCSGRVEELEKILFKNPSNGNIGIGHVDGVAEIKKIEKKPKEVKIWFKIPKSLKKYVVQKGSIALDGISLTVVDVKNDLGSVCLIPHTMQITNFKTKKINDKLNIETDVLGKYILK